MARISLQNVKKSYGQTHVIKGVDIEINDGEFCVFVGPSGCGKSTLLRMIAGLEDISSGELRIGEAVVNELPPAQRGVAMVFQSYAIFPHMTVRENVAFGLTISGASKEEKDAKVAEAARILQMEHLLDRRPSQLSGGQRQRVAIARVILKDAPILILDEATSALDSEAEAAIQGALYGVMEGKTVIAIAHRLSTIAAMDRIVVLEDGEVVEDGPHADLLRKGGLYARFWARQSGGFIGLEEEAAE